MKDPKRIEPTLKAIREFWVQYPGLRFGQLVCILATVAGADTFFVEDDALAEAAIAKQIHHQQGRSHEQASS
jgi:hypothetical protein